MAPDAGNMPVSAHGPIYSPEEQEAMAAQVEQMAEVDTHVHIHVDIPHIEEPDENGLIEENGLGLPVNLDSESD